MQAQTADKIDQAINFVEESYRQLEEGKMVDLENFQQEVAAICKKMNSLPVVEAQIHFEKMDKLEEVLQVFEVALRQQKSEVEHRIKSLNKQKTASTAYTKTDKSSD